MKSIKPLLNTFYSEVLVSESPATSNGKGKERERNDEGLLPQPTLIDTEPTREFTTVGGLGNGWHGGLCVYDPMSALRSPAASSTNSQATRASPSRRLVLRLTRTGCERSRRCDYGPTTFKVSAGRYLRLMRAASRHRCRSRSLLKSLLAHTPSPRPQSYATALPDLRTADPGWPAKSTTRRDLGGLLGLNPLARAPRRRVRTGARGERGQDVAFDRGDREGP